MGCQILFAGRSAICRAALWRRRICGKFLRAAATAGGESWTVFFGQAREASSPGAGEVGNEGAGGAAAIADQAEIVSRRVPTRLGPKNTPVLVDANQRRGEKKEYQT